MIYNIVFSATGRCEETLNALSGCWEGEKTKIDLSLQDMPRHSFTAEDLCFVALPVYGGRGPAPAVKNMKKLSGNGARAVLMAVYGNRAIDDTLVEMQDTLTAQGFVCVAGIEAVAEHSIFPKYGANRPDKADRAELKEFAGKIKAYLANSEAAGQLKLPGNRPYKAAMSMPFVPRTTDKCIDCKKCALNCPAKAIPLDNPRTTEKDKCMFCLRCVEICPADARQIPLPKPIFSLMSAVMGKELGGHKPNVLYLPQ